MLQSYRLCFLSWAYVAINQKQNRFTKLSSETVQFGIARKNSWWIVGFYFFWHLIQMHCHSLRVEINESKFPNRMKLSCIVKRLGTMISQESLSDFYLLFICYSFGNSVPLFIFQRLLKRWTLNTQELTEFLLLKKEMVNITAFE